MTGSLVEYLKYSYYRYAVEREAGHEDAALAVLEGLCDALARRFGPFARWPRPFLPLLRGLFNTWHNHRKGRKEPQRPAVALY
jgi:hypothetical protein